MSKNTVVELKSPDTIQDPLIEMLRVGAQRLIQHAVEVELQKDKLDGCTGSIIR